MKLRLYSVILLLSCLGLSESYAAVGKIAGRVRDAKTGEEVVGANIVLQGTSMGASTNLDGYYVILNVPPGKYTAVASGVGYQRQVINNVSVSIDLTTTIDINLTQVVVDVGEEIVITAEKPIIQKDLTAKTAIVGNEEIAALPVTEVSQVLSLQAGFVAGSLRGGRSGEVAYWIDGVPVTDVYDGGQVVEVNKNLVQEMQLVSGAFNAEYGQAMSGIVNIATKEGGSKFTGGIGVYGGDYFSSRDGIFPGIKSTSPTAIRNIEGNISGPVVGDDLTFFANGRYIYFDGWLHGYRRFNPHNIATTIRDSTTGQDVFRLYRDASGRGDSSRVSMNASERRYAQGKLTWRISGTMKSSVNFIFDDNEQRAFSESYFYNPDGLGTNFNKSYTTIFQLSHTISARTFYTLGGSFFDKKYNYYVYENPFDPRYTHPQLFRTDDSYSFLTGGTDLNRTSRRTTTLLGKFDISSQIDEHNLVKVGIEYRRHKLFFQSYNLQPVQAQTAFDPATSSPFITTEIPPLSSNSHSMYNRSPQEFSAYIQDKLEFSDFILNIGVRFDYFNPDGLVLADESDPNIYSPIKDENRARTLEERRTYWYKPASKKTQFSPRIGASFPITARGVVHFSYGHFFQIPRFERLYENPDFKIGFGTGNQGIIGNADLKPEQTINGEIGVQQQITDDISVDVTAYIRDIRNLTTTGADEIVVFGGSAKYSKYQNRDFGTVKGIVLTVDKRFAGGLAASVDYTYQVARGSGSDPQESRNAVLGGTLPEIQLTPLGWDQRHTLNATMAYNAQSWGASFIAQYGSGTPYTPRRSTDITALLTNSQTKPAFFNIDARFYYAVPVDIFRMVAFLRVFNLLDTENEVGVFDDTGRAGFTTDLDKARRENTLQRINSVEDFFRRPRFYSEPRRIEFGVNIEF